ncbi:MAG: NADPH-dependent glutamate synthase [Firmicutes bacterium]|nr:NADPH-dependent glutamate synthase [Bacillota bacterium]
MIVKARNPMPEQKPQERVKNFLEVPLGFDEATAISEAERCLQCKKPLCVEGCPVHVPIPQFIQLIKEGKFVEASLKIKEVNNLPAICGRVCPQESQCECKCVLSKKHEPVAIGRLERFAADYERKAGISLPIKPVSNGKAIAIVGAGPAGLTCAGDMARLGYKVTVFEALHEPGGVLTYGIPPFRLPRDIMKSEFNYIRAMGVEIVPNVIIGRSITIPEIFKDGYKAVFVGTGAGAPMFLDIPGENSLGVMSANEFLTRVNLMNSYRYPDFDTPIPMPSRVTVVGAGNVAMDACRTALRLGAEKVYCVYRRSRAEMPARNEEIHHAEEEGVIFRLLTNPLRFIEDESGWISGMECIQMELGEPDDSGRRRPMPKAGSEFVLDTELAIIAVGTRSNPLIRQTTPGLKTDRKGYIEADSLTQATSLPGVFAGGDIVTGAATVIEAMGAGKNAAASMHRFLA